MKHIKKLDEMNVNDSGVPRNGSRAINEWGAFGDGDTWLDFFGTIARMGDIYKFDKLCPDTELTEDDVKDSMNTFGVNVPLNRITEAYYDAIWGAFVREVREEYDLTDDEVGKLEMDTNPIEFHYGDEYFETKAELDQILRKSLRKRR